MKRHRGLKQQGSWREMMRSLEIECQHTEKKGEVGKQGSRWGLSLYLLLGFPCNSTSFSIPLGFCRVSALQFTLTER